MVTISLWTLVAAFIAGGTLGFLLTALLWSSRDSSDSLDCEHAARLVYQKQLQITDLEVACQTLGQRVRELESQLHDTQGGA